MNVYVESNFVLELAFLQAQHLSCEGLLGLSEAGQIQLVIPAYSLVEPYETLGRRQKDRKQLKADLDRELTQLERTSAYSERLGNLQNITALLNESAEEETARLQNVRGRLLRSAEVIPLGEEILGTAIACATAYDLSPQDALVCASVLMHLDRTTPRESCFLNRDVKDFKNPDLVDALRQRSCRMLPGFDIGHSLLTASH